LRVRPWGSLGYRDYRLLWLSGFFGALGEQSRRTVDLWLVYELSGGSPVQLGFLGLAQAAPVLIMSWFGGVLADLVDRRKLMLIGQVVRTTLAILLAVLAVSGVVQVWHIYAITAAMGIAQTTEQPARVSLIPAVVPRSHLLNAMTLQQAMRQASVLTGPTLAGVIIATSGVGVAYTIHAGLYVPAFITLLFIRTRPSAELGGLRSFKIGQTLDGMRFVLTTPFVAAMLVLDFCATVLTSWRVLMPIIAVEILGGDAKTLGILLAAPAVGRLIGSTGMLLAGGVQRQGLFVLTAIMSYGVSVMLFSLSRDLWLSLILMAFVGGTDGAGAIVRNTLIQLVVPDDRPGGSHRAGRVGRAISGGCIRGDVCVGGGVQGA
jgi:MFS family permease